MACWEFVLARQSGVPYVIIFPKICDMAADMAAGEESPAFVENEGGDLLSQCGYPGDAAPIIRGSAIKAFGGYTEWKAKINGLKGYKDNYISNSESAI